VFVTPDTENDVSQLTTHGDGLSELKLPRRSVTGECSEMNQRRDQRCSYMTAHQFTPGVRCVAPVGSSLQTPFDSRVRASQNFHPRDAAHVRPSAGHSMNSMLGAHCMPEATPFQAIRAPLENAAAAQRPRSWHVSPSKGEHGGAADGDVGAGRTPSFRRTPGARRSSPRAPNNAQPLPVPRPLIRPSPCFQTGPPSGTYLTRPFQEFVENDLGKPQSAATYPALVKSRNGITEPVRFEAGSSSMTDGVELVVSNLDYNISLHEWKKILTCELQQQVQVCFVDIICSLFERKLTFLCSVCS